MEPTTKRTRGRQPGANYGTRAGGRPRRAKTLVINGVIQDGHWTVVSVTKETIVIEEAPPVANRQIEISRRNAGERIEDYEYR